MKISPLERCLLALVFADSPEGISRVRAAEILWDEPVGPKHRRHLSSMMHKINRKAGVQVITGDEEWLRTGKDVQPSIDQSSLQREASGGGRFLSLCSKAPSGSFEEWRSRRERRITGMLKEHFESELDRARGQGEWERADAIIQILAGVEDDDGEGEYRDLAERSAAILSERSADPSGKPRAASTVEEVSDLFVGRTAEVRELVGSVVTRRDGFGLSLVTGVAGIGKTTLLKEVARRIAQTDTAIFRCSCSEPASNITLGPLIDVIAGKDMAGHIDQMGSPWREVVLSLIPHRAPSESRAALPYIDPKQIPVRLYEALRRLFESVCSVRPVLLIIDNYEWHDATTHAALSFIGSHWRKGRLQVAIAARSKDEDIEAMIPMLEEERVPVNHVTLEELSAESALELVLRVIPDTEPRTLQHVCEAASGHPLFLVELAREVSAGLDPRAGALLSPSITDIVVARLGRLEENDRRLLSLIAVIGRPTTLTELSTIGRSELLSTAEAAGRLAELHLVSESHGRVDIRHDLTRRAMYSKLTPTSRALLHRSIAEGLESESTEVAAELAHHFAEAGMDDRALKYATQAADLAESTGGVGEAVRFLKLARRLTEDEGQDTQLLGRLADLEYLHGEPSETIPLLELAAGRLEAVGDMAGSIRARVHKVDLLRVMGRWSTDDLGSELDLIKELARSHSVPEEEAHSILVHVRIAQRRADRKLAAVLFDQAEEILRSSTSPRAHTRAYCALAHAMVIGDATAGREAARKAVELTVLHDLTNLAPMARSLHVSALIAAGLLATKEGRAALKGARAAAEQSGDAIRIVRLMANEGVWCLDTGRLEEARGFLERARDTVRGPAKHEEAGLIELNLGELELTQGNFETALTHFSRAETLLPAPVHGDHLWRWIREAGPGLCHLRLGQTGQALLRLSQTPPFPDDWLTDPTIPTTFVAEMQMRRGEGRDAIRLVADVISLTVSRFPVHAFRLQILHSRLARRVDEEWGRSIAEDALRQSNIPGTGELIAVLRGLAARH